MGAGVVRDYESWSFRDKSFSFALGLSLLWHFFWFFSISIVVTPLKVSGSGRPVIVSLGPVLDDSILRTLAQTKPQISETFYRRLSDFTAPMDLEVTTVERHSPGDVVSVPFGKRVTSLLRTLVGGEKSAPHYEFSSRIKLGYSEENYVVEGEIKARSVVSKPKEPILPPDFDAAAKPAEIEVQFVVDPAGIVAKADVTLSSGRPEVDALWAQYLKGWQFSPLEIGKPLVDQSGKVRFRLGGEAFKE